MLDDILDTPLDKMTEGGGGATELRKKSLDIEALAKQGRSPSDVGGDEPGSGNPPPPRKSAAQQAEDDRIALELLGDILDTPSDLRT